MSEIIKLDVLKHFYQIYEYYDDKSSLYFKTTKQFPVSSFSPLESNIHEVIRQLAEYSNTTLSSEVEELEITKQVSKAIEGKELEDIATTTKLGAMFGSYLMANLLASKPSLFIEALRRTGLLHLFLPEVASCYGVSQNTTYHPYDVYEHSLLALDRCDSMDWRIKMAALLHDTGKPDTKGEGPKGITFHKHEVVSKNLAKKIMRRFYCSDSQTKNREFVVSLVANHMYQYSKEWKDSTVRKFAAKIGITKDYIGKMHSHPQFILRDADRMGRDLIPITQKQRDFEKRLEKLLLET